MRKVSLGTGATAYDLAAEDHPRVELEVAIPAGRSEIHIVNAGPNDVYYHTEGNPPGAGDNDNGTIKAGGESRFFITPALVFVPKVYVHAKFGPTKVAVFVGPMKLQGNIVDVVQVVQAVVAALKS